MKRTQDEEAKGMFYDNIEYFIYREIRTILAKRRHESCQKFKAEKKYEEKRAENYNNATVNFYRRSERCLGATARLP